MKKRKINKSWEKRKRKKVKRRAKRTPEPFKVILKERYRPFYSQELW